MNRNSVLLAALFGSMALAAGCAETPAPASASAPAHQHEHASMGPGMMGAGMMANADGGCPMMGGAAEPGMHGTMMGGDSGAPMMGQGMGAGMRGPMGDGGCPCCPSR